jgi:hypothetical protein
VLHFDLSQLSALRFDEFAWARIRSGSVDGFGLRLDNKQFDGFSK